MEEHDIAEMALMEQTYWWHQGKRRLIDSVLSKYYKGQAGKILDYGCGAGENLKLLSAYGETFGADTSHLAVDFCKEKKLPHVHLIQPGEVPEGPFRLITAFDVVEHIRDDIDILTKFHKAIEPNGFLFISVPAYRFLWSEHDEALMHVRRYVASELRAKLTMTGFDVIRITYAVTFVFFPILFYRLVRGIFPQSYDKPKVSYVELPGFLNSLFYQSLVLESKLIKFMNLPFGCSLLVIARRK
mgnify:CR=1 FL=1